MILLIRWARCWRQTAAGKDDSPGTTRNTKLSIVQAIDFQLLASRGFSPIFHSNGHPCFEQSIWSDGTAGVSSSNRTVPNRSKSWTKNLCVLVYFALSHSRSVWSLDFSAKYPFLSELQSLLLSIVHFSRQIPRYFAVTICLSWGFLRCCSSKPCAQGFRSWGSPLWIMPSRLPSSFP